MNGYRNAFFVPLEWRSILFVECLREDVPWDVIVTIAATDAYIDLKTADSIKGMAVGIPPDMVDLFLSVLRATHTQSQKCRRLRMIRCLL